MIVNGVEYLFHYTSIESLALILKNKTIRLNPLCHMDDLQEGKTRDLQELGRFFFVSSWTNEDKESIPMWNMYTKMDAGVRIALPKNPFVWHRTKKEDLEKVFHSKSEGDEEVNTFLNIAELLQQGVFSIQAWSGDILIKVEYTDNKDLLEPKIVSNKGQKKDLDFSCIGKYKNKYWDFQKEWRYMMTFIPFTVTGDFNKTYQQFMSIVHQMAQDSLAAPFQYYDLEISTEALNAMIITPSPKMSVGNRTILEALINQYNRNAVIKESALSGLI